MLLLKTIVPEIEVSKFDEWNSAKIEERGLQLLNFMEKRWDIKFKDEEDKKTLLFLDAKNESADDWSCRQSLRMPACRWCAGKSGWIQSPDEIRCSYPDGVRELADGGTWNTIAGHFPHIKPYLLHNAINNSSLRCRKELSEHSTSADFVIISIFKVETTGFQPVRFHLGWLSGSWLLPRPFESGF